MLSRRLSTAAVRRRRERLRREGIVPMSVELAPEVEDGVAELAEAEGRSKRRQLAVLTRRVVSLWRTRPEELQRLGIVEHHGS